MCKSLRSLILLVLIVIAVIQANSVLAQQDNQDADEDKDVPENLVKSLTVETFEHLTQASTGMTTGDWFIKFYSPNCEWCKRMAEPWIFLSDSLKGEINVAEVNCITDNEVCQRFGVAYYPVIILLKQKKMYLYDGKSPRELDDFIAFAREGFKKAEAKDIPPEPTLQDKFLKWVNMVEKDFHYLAATKKGVVAVIVIASALIGYTLGYLFKSLTGANPKVKTK